MASAWQLGRVLLIGLVAVLIVGGLGVIAAGLALREELAEPDTPVNALAGSDSECVTCHRDETPGIVTQYAFSTMAAAGVTCRDCHEIPEAYPEATKAPSC
jgi:nitrate/TMAO reductase-like tetraheme cytochrome c subunit